MIPHYSYILLVQAFAEAECIRKEDFYKMTINELSKNLDQAISTYETEAGAACNYCDETTGDALSTMRKATVNALSSFKAELLTYLNQN